ncbi:hypothetical protein [Corynebacterium pseudodiphtheriticum]|uniref:hypothetical protein n=1 Tax=Corynebacterium pseudodiphtheriticum TaxID=37637 RepID=UPI00253FFF0B|nr:hypothetical protein [Corynebacterium pseudodiphtheriticum]MDK4321892.1 hypothetical protein [Corynebacterium pseudodiphtheriticum]
MQSEQSRLAREEALKKLYAASASRSVENNILGLIEATRLHLERAELLDYASHADYIIARKPLAVPTPRIACSRTLPPPQRPMPPVNRNCWQKKPIYDNPAKHRLAAQEADALAKFMETPLPQVNRCK